MTSSNSAKQSGLARSLTRAAMISMTAASLLGAAAAAAQAISDTPMAVANNAAPNMMFMIDNSGSMRNIVPGSPYKADTTYPCSGGTPLNGYATKALAADGTSAVRIDIRTYNNKPGVPIFTYKGNRYRHATVEPTSTDTTSTKACFNSGQFYRGLLLGDDGGTPSNSYLASLYTGNFLNWYFSTIDGPGSGWADRKILASTTLKVQTRIEAAQEVSKSVIATLPVVPDSATKASVRVGLSTYRNGDGGKLLVAVDDLKTTRLANINAGIAALTADGTTPLAETLADIGRYFATGYNDKVSAGSVEGVKIDEFFKQDGRDSCLYGGSCTSTSAAKPIQYWCQRSYVYLMTDGRPNGDQAFSNNAYLRDYDGDCTGDVNKLQCVASGDKSAYDKKTARNYEPDGSDYLDDVAKALKDIDLRPDLVPPSGSKPGPNNILTYPIGFADAQVEDDPLMQSTATQGGGKFLYASDGPALVKAFKTVITDAFKKDAAAAAVAVASPKISVDRTGYATSYTAALWYGDLTAYEADTITGLPDGSSLWSAQLLLDGMPHSARKIVSYNGTTGVEFNTANFPVSATFPDGLVNFLRGDRSKEQAQSGPFRDRLHLLGDIVNAEPVFVSYSTQAGVRRIIYQGANDGMLHVFDGSPRGATAGKELWAYVPRLVHGNLKALADANYATSHKFFVDGTPAVADVTGFGSMTKLLVGALGKGGRGYYALDITSPEAVDVSAAISKVKWEFGSANMGYSFGTPLIVNTSTGWKVIVSSGYDNGSAVNGDGGGYVWVLNPRTGAVEKTFKTGVGVAAAPSGLAHLAKLSSAGADAVIRYVYGGDNLGNVWRFDLDAPNNSTATLLAQLVDATGAAQPVTSAPVVGQFGTDATKMFVFVGTGRYLSMGDVSMTQRQTMYGLIDNTALTGTAAKITNLRGSNCSANNGSLVCQTLSYNADLNTYRASTLDVTSARRGWYLDLPDDTRLTGGRIDTRPDLTTYGTLVFTVNVPTNVVCDRGGSSWLFQVNGATGGAIAQHVGGTTYYDSADFIANALSSRVVIVEGSGGDRGLNHQSDRKDSSTELHRPSSPPAPFKRVYWRILK